MWANVPLHEQLHYQSPNPFIPRDLALIASVEDSSDFPVVIHRSDPSCVWYQQDSIFKAPRVHAAFYFAVPSVASSAAMMVLSDLYVHLVKDALNAFLYHAQAAQLTYSLHLKESGFEMFAGGFNDKVPDLIGIIVKTLVSLQFENGRFLIVREELIRQYKNALMKPHRKVKYLRLQLIEHINFPLPELLKALEAVTVDDLRQYAQNHLWKEGTHVTSFFHGNITKTKADEIAADVLTHMPNITSIHKAHHMIPYKVYALPLGQTIDIWEESDHISEVNTLVELYMQIGSHTIATLAAADLIQQMMEEPLFHALRTKKQLG
jgi:secreted Zn-dependent insulinase-like peptidase